MPSRLRMTRGALEAATVVARFGLQFSHVHITFEVDCKDVGHYGWIPALAQGAQCLVFSY